MRVHAGRVPSIAVFALSAIAFVAGIQRGRVDAKGAPVQSSATPAGRAGGPQAPAGTGIVIGRVIDATTSRPVSGAIVMMTGGPSATSTTGPLSGLVSSVGVVPDAPTSTAPRQIITDAEGHFVFRDLAHGRYTLRTTAAGYLAGVYGQNRPAGASQSLELVTDDDRVADATIRMWKTATISGTVVDEAGDPMVGALVRTMRRSTTAGQVRLITGATATTDDRGMYRMVSLSPGDYIVGIISMQSTSPASFVESYKQLLSSGGGTTELMMQIELGGPSPLSAGYRVGDLILQSPSTGRAGGSMSSPAPGDDGRVFVYPTVYYPSASSARQATVLALNAGDDRGHVDLQMKLSPTVRVSGTVIGPNGPVANLGVMLGPPDEDAQSAANTDAASTVTNGVGAFTFLGVTPGQYKLKTSINPRSPTVSSPSSMTRVEVTGPNGGIMTMTTGGSSTTPPPPLPTAPTLWATMPLAVAQADIAGLAVTLQTGVRLTGRLVFEGTKEKPTGLQLQRTSIQLLPTESRLSPLATPVRVEMDGTFNTGGYVPGRYTITSTVLPLPGGVTGWIFKSATMAGRNISDAPFELGADVAGDLVVTFTDQTTELSGLATNAKGGPDKDADVIVFPADTQNWRQGTGSGRRMRDLRPSDQGVFTVTGLPPGDYFVAAVIGEFPVDWQDPKFLERVAGVASRITLADGEKKSVSLSTKTVR